MAGKTKEAKPTFTWPGFSPFTAKVVLGDSGSTTLHRPPVQLPPDFDNA